MNFQSYFLSGLLNESAFISKMFLGCTNLVIKKRKLLMKVGLVIAVLVWASAAYAIEVTLQWDRNREDDLAGYVVHYGTRSGQYRWQEDIKLRGCNSRTCSATFELSEERWYFSVTAYDKDGYESRYSREVVANLGPKKTLAWLDLLLGKE